MMIVSHASSKRKLRMFPEFEDHQLPCRAFPDAITWHGLWTERQSSIQFRGKKRSQEEVPRSTPTEAGGAGMFSGMFSVNCDELEEEANAHILDGFITHRSIPGTKASPSPTTRRPVWCSSPNRTLEASETTCPLHDAASS